MSSLRDENLRVRKKIGGRGGGGGATNHFCTWCILEGY